MWKLLEEGEQVFPGDEFYRHLFGWVKFEKLDLRSKKPVVMTEDYLPVRRKISEQVVEQNTANNSDYTAAIRCVKEYFQSRPDSTMLGVFRVWCEDRLNPAKRDFV